MKKVSLAGGMICIALATSGCGTLYKLDVTAYNNPNVELDKSYVILSGSPNIPVSSPQFAEYASQVERALEPKGYTRSPNDDLTTAALGIYVSMNVSDPSKRFHSVKTGMYESPYPNESASQVRSSGGGGGGGGGGGASGGVTMPATPAPELLSGVSETGYATTVYTKHLNLVAIDLQQFIKDIAEVGREEAEPVEVWSIDIETTGQPKDLDEVFPVMMAAGQPYVGDSTEDVVQLKMSGTDKRVSQIKRPE
jgi:hypothetical protein